VDLNRVDWTGGRLVLSECLLRGNDREGGGLPLWIGPGQELVLQGATFQYADTAIVVDGGLLHCSAGLIADCQRGIVLKEALSVANLSQTNFCNCARALEVLAAQEVELQQSLFLTNETAIYCLDGDGFSIDDCLLQANDNALIIPDGASVPAVGQAVDFADARQYLLDNQSGIPVDLGLNYVSDPGLLNGMYIWNEEEAAPDAVHPLKSAEPPWETTVVGDGGIVDVPLSWVPAGVTIDGLPCKESSYMIYRSTQPYAGFEYYDTVEETEAVISTGGEPRLFLRVTANLGVWVSGE